MEPCFFPSGFWSIFHVAFLRIPQNLKIVKKLEKMLHVRSKMLHSVGFDTFFAFWSILEHLCSILEHFGAFWSISGNRKNKLQNAT